MGTPLVSSLSMLWSGPLEWLSVGLLLVGVLFFWRGRRGRRSDRLHCAKCLHALAQTSLAEIAPDACCPECGHPLSSASRSSQGASKRMRSSVRTSLPRPWITSIGPVLACAGVCFWLYNGALGGIGRLVLPRYKVKETHTTLGCEVTISNPRWSDDLASPIVEIRQRGRVVFASSMSHPSVGSARLRDPLCEEPVSLLWIRSDSGGSLGLSETFTFRIGASTADGIANANNTGYPDFLPYAVLHEGSFAKSDPEQPEPDVWVAYELAYKYWLTSGVNSPTIAMRGTPTPSGIVWNSPDESDAPNADALEAVAGRVRQLASATEPEMFTGAHCDQALGLVLDAFLELVYAGRAGEAWPFLRARYEDGLGALMTASQRAEVPRSLDALERAILEQMQRSTFMEEVLRRNGGSIAPPTDSTSAPISAQ